MPTPGRSPWDVLGIAENAPFNEVKRAFYSKARQTHPDTTGSGDTAAFRAVQAAFDALSRRAAAERRHIRARQATPYDSWLSTPAPSRSWPDTDPMVAASRWASKPVAGAGFDADTAFARLLESEITLLAA